MCFIKAGRQTVSYRVWALHCRRRLHTSIIRLLIMVRGNGAIFLAGPPLVKATTGENVSAEELGGADLHSQISGTCDYSADSEEQAIELGREVVEYWSENKISIYPRENVSEPYYSPTELYGIIPDDIKKAYDSREVIARIVDASNFHEFQPQYGKNSNMWICIYLGL